jgi:RNA polymerase sigma-70 factor (ECF subfamily)
MTRADAASTGDCTTAFREEFEYVCQSLRRLGVRSSDIEDLAHEVFLVLHRRWEHYDPARPLRPWLFGIALRVVSTRRKALQREIPQAVFELEDLAASPDDALSEQQTRALVLAALEQLPLARRSVLVMHDIDEVDMRTIAATLSIPRFTAYSRLRKARKEFESAVRMLQQATRAR